MIGKNVNKNKQKDILKYHISKSERQEYKNWLYRHNAMKRCIITEPRQMNIAKTDLTVKVIFNKTNQRIL